jgi:hypothetical protein
VRFYEHHSNDPSIKDRCGSGLLSVFGHYAPEQMVNFSVSIYPRIFLHNPTSAVRLRREPVCTKEIS